MEEQTEVWPKIQLQISIKALSYFIVVIVQKPPATKPWEIWPIKYSKWNCSLAFGNDQISTVSHIFLFYRLLLCEWYILFHRWNQLLADQDHLVEPIMYRMPVQEAQPQVRNAGHSRNQLLLTLYHEQASDRMRQVSNINDSIWRTCFAAIGRQTNKQNGKTTNCTNKHTYTHTRHTQTHIPNSNQTSHTLSNLNRNKPQNESTTKP